MKLQQPPLHPHQNSRLPARLRGRIIAGSVRFSVSSTGSAPSFMAFRAHAHVCTYARLIVLAEKAAAAAAARRTSKCQETTSVQQHIALSRDAAEMLRTRVRSGSESKWESFRAKRNVSMWPVVNAWMRWCWFFDNIHKLNIIAYGWVSFVPVRLGIGEIFWHKQTHWELMFVVSVLFDLCFFSDARPSKRNN